MHPSLSEKLKQIEILEQKFKREDLETDQ